MKRTIKGKELLALQELVNIAMRKIGSNLMPSDEIGYDVLDYRVESISLTINKNKTRPTTPTVN